MKISEAITFCLQYQKAISKVNTLKNMELDRFNGGRPSTSAEDSGLNQIASFERWRTETSPSAVPNSSWQDK